MTTDHDSDPVSPPIQTLDAQALARRREALKTIAKVGIASGAVMAVLGTSSASADGDASGPPPGPA